MQLVYTDENRLLVEHAKNLLAQANIDVFVKNEFIAGAAGELAPLDTWLELWVEEPHLADAKALLSEAFTKTRSNDWRCGKCSELNDPSFEYCWQCQSPCEQ